MKTEAVVIKNINELKEIEKPSSYLSEVYVPIYSSRIIEYLEPEYTFIRAEKYYPGSTKHTVTLKNKDDDTIIFFNSYDGKRAFSMIFNYGNISIPLDIDKQVHKGENAKTIQNEIKINKQQIFDAIKYAKHIVNALKATKVREEDKKFIEDEVFKRIKKRENFISLEQFKTNRSTETFFDYIENTVDNYLEGNYHIVIKNAKNQEKNRVGRRVKSKFERLEITNRVFKTLFKNRPDIFI